MKIIVIDDHVAFRDSLRIALWHEASIEVIAEASTAREAIPLVESRKPDLLVADLMLSDTDGISLARELRRRGNRTPILIVTAHPNDLFVRDAFDTHVNGYVLKEQPLTEVIEAMRTVSGGERYIAPRLGPTVPDRPATDGQVSGMEQLSRREREIFGRIIEGLSSRDIAQTLCISLKTVETHRSHINRKLGVHSPAELIRLAALKGLLSSATREMVPDAPVTTATADAPAA
jgi:two-component system response regulator NreC